MTRCAEFFRHLGLFESWAATYITMNFVSGLPVLFGFAMYTGGPKAAFANWTMVGGYVRAAAAVTTDPSSHFCLSHPDQADSTGTDFAAPGCPSSSPSPWPRSRPPSPPRGASTSGATASGARGTAAC